eukprot:1980285-Pleurochrysis_carterae.AAC.1
MAAMDTNLDTTGYGGSDGEDNEYMEPVRKGFFPNIEEHAKLGIINEVEEFRLNGKDFPVLFYK